MSSPLLGIDLGTTNSLVGVVDSGFPILLADQDGRRLLPSAVHFPRTGEAPLTGHPALRCLAVEPERTVTSIKRFMGRRIDEVQPTEADHRLVRLDGDRLGLRIGSQIHTPEQISAHLLRRLKTIAETALETAVSRAVITVPAYFNDAQRHATKTAGELAGLTVERILAEPTAAALAYGLDKLAEQSRVAVFDLGGGTFDISILELRDGVFQVIATAGDTRLGGDDIDRALASWIQSECDLPGDLSIQARLRQAARQAKEELSSKPEVELALPFLTADRNLSITVSRSILEKIASPFVQRTRAHCLRALADAGIAAASRELDQVILVGGSTRMPLVRNFVESVFGLPPNLSQHPDEAVALGATIQAGMLSGALRQMLLLDVTPLSLGIETFGGLMNVIIPRNTTIPAKAGELFTNAVPNQSEMLIRVLQGEREMARDNWELGQLTLNFEPGPKGSARVGVQFQIDANGILQVLARDTRTNTDQVLAIQHAAVNVEDDAVERMIAESVDFAFADMNERILTEARLKSEELLTAVDDALGKAGSELDPGEREAIRIAATAVRAALEATPADAQRLKQANRTLDEATEHLAAILVEKALSAGLGNAVAG